MEYRKNPASRHEIYEHIDSYTERGWHLFPVRDQRKTPACKNGFYAATLDVGQLRRVWENTLFNIGIRTGKESRIVVVDFDVSYEEMMHLCDEWSLDIDGPVVRTPKKRWHRYYAYPKGEEHVPCSSSMLHKGVDIRADGGYVVAPPSRVTGGTFYDWFSNESEDPPELPVMFVKRLCSHAARARPEGGALLVQEEDGKIRLASQMVGANQCLVTTAHSMRASGFPIKATIAALKAMKDDLATSTQGRTVDDAECERVAVCAYKKDIGEGVTLAERAIADGMVGKQLITQEVIDRKEKLDIDFDAGDLEPDGVIQEMTESILKMSRRKQPALALGAAICFMGSLIAGKVKSDIGGWPSVYMIGVAGSGYGKDAPRVVIPRYYEAAGHGEHIMAGDMASDTGFVGEVQANPNGLFIIDELGKFFGSIKGRNAAQHLAGLPNTLMQLYSCTGNMFRGKAYKERSRNVSIKEPCINFYGMTTPTTLYSALGSDDIHDGFLSRFMYIRGSQSLPKQEVLSDFALNEHLLNVVRYWMQTIATDGPIVIEHSTDGLVANRELAEYFDALARSETHELAQTLWTRATEKINRLTPIFTMSLERDSRVAEIGRDVVERCARLVEKMTKQCIYDVQDKMADSATEKNKKDLHYKIRRFGPLTENQLASMTPGLAKKQRKELLEDMLTSHWVDLVPHMISGREVLAYTALSIDNAF